MPYFKVRLDLNQELLTRLRSLPVRAQQNLKTAIATQLAPELQQDANDLMEQGPSRVDPFTFGTEKSKWYYLHVMIPQGMVQTDGAHYLRESGPDSVQGGFRVEVSTTRFSIGMIQIRNIDPAGKFVFGPFTVAGHSITGWPEHAQIAGQLLRKKTVERVGELWKQAIKDAARDVR